METSERKHSFVLTEEAIEAHPEMFPVVDKASAVGTEVMLTDAEAEIVGILPKGEASDVGSTTSSEGNNSQTGHSEVCPRCGFSKGGDKE